MTATEAIAQITRSAFEVELRASVAALPADYLARIGLDSPEAIEAYIAAEVADQ